MTRKRQGRPALKRIVIGENMKRIRIAARQIGAKWYQGWPVDPWDVDVAMKRNRRWIIEKMRKDYEIVDIGIDPTRTFRSQFYQMERQLLQTSNYPVMRYDKIIRS